MSAHQSIRSSFYFFYRLSFLAKKLARTTSRLFNNISLYTSCIVIMPLRYFLCSFHVSHRRTSVVDVFIFSCSSLLQKIVIDITWSEIFKCILHRSFFNSCISSLLIF